MSGDDSVVVRRLIRASAERLFDAWLDAESLGSWLRPSGIRRTGAETDPRVGGGFRIVMDDGAGSSILHTGVYREIKRPHLLVFTWSSPATHFHDSLVTVSFVPSGDSTMVEVRQVGLPDSEAETSHHAGWSDVLHQLSAMFTCK